MITPPADRGRPESEIGHNAGTNCHPLLEYKAANSGQGTKLDL